jgi:hypothetical protein
MKPLIECPPTELARIEGVLTDIDDTLTTDGRLPSLAYTALESLKRAGLLVIPITGRPAGWCDHIARMWPVDAVVGENGAFWFRYDRASRTLERRFLASAEERISQRARLRQIAADILAQVPGAQIAADQLYREADLAIDYCEDVEALDASKVEQIVYIMQAHGLTAKVSSIHVNGWFGSHDKLSTTLALLEECFGIGTCAARGRFAFVGDSPNDQPMFAYFTHAIGVANVRSFIGQLATLPSYVTNKPAGAGFAEFTEQLLRARRERCKQTG